MLTLILSDSTRSLTRGDVSAIGVGMLIRSSAVGRITETIWLQRMHQVFDEGIASNRLPKRSDYARMNEQLLKRRIELSSMPEQGRRT